MSQLDMFALPDDVKQQEERDTVGGFAPWPSGLYKAKLKAAFLGSFDGGSRYIEVITELTNEAGDTREVSERETVWSSKTKGPFYVDKKTGEKKELIGKAKMDALGRLICGKDLSQSVFEEKFHKIYDKAAKGETNQARPTLVEWSGADLYVGLVAIQENKSTKATDSAGKVTYVPTADIREFNSVDKFFNDKKQTILEVTQGVDAEFYTDWVKANDGKVRDKTKKGIAPAAGAPAAGVPSATATPLNFNE